MVSLHLQARIGQVAAELSAALSAPGQALAPAALAIARVEYPSLETAPYLDQLDRMGEEAAGRLSRRSGGDPEEAVRVFNEYLYDELGFTGNRDRYEDPRNSFLNEVLDRRTGIPISLAVVYLEVARRAGLQVSGVNFPGHFLLRAIGDRSPDPVVIIDPFHGGALLSEVDCRELLRQHVGDEAAFDSTLLEPATRSHIVVRTLVNLKRLYVRMRSFPHARFIADLLLTVDPSAISELRDRGLLAYHLQDYNSALRDLEEYLRLIPKPPRDASGTDAPGGRAGGPEDDGHDARAAEDARESTQIWEHVKNLRKRVAAFN